jgi:DNA-binding IclR family transcriptional regulator
VASLELLDALSRGANTVTTVATVLGISRAEAARQLSAATASGLVGWEDADSHLTHLEADRRFARLSTAGLEELHRLQEAAAGR